MKFDLIVNGPLDVNTYLLYHEVGKCYVIDPGHDYKQIINFINRRHVKVTAIILTHGHFDHIAGVNELVKAFNCPVYLHLNDAKMVKSIALNYSFAFNESIIIDSYIEDINSLNNEDIEVIHTPGHSRGSCCLYLNNDKLLFSGDTLFKDGVGRTDLHGSSLDELNKSIKKLFLLDDDVIVLPGHGEETTILQEKYTQGI